MQTEKNPVSLLAKAISSQLSDQEEEIPVCTGINASGKKAIKQGRHMRWEKATAKADGEKRVSFLKEYRRGGINSFIQTGSQRETCLHQCAAKIWPH